MASTTQNKQDNVVPLYQKKRHSRKKLESKSEGIGIRWLVGIIITIVAAFLGTIGTVTYTINSNIDIVNTNVRDLKSDIRSLNERLNNIHSSLDKRLDDLDKKIVRIETILETQNHGSSQ